MTINAGATEAYKVCVGSTRVSKIYQGTDLIHNRYFVEHTGTLSASDEAEWGTTGSATFSRQNSDTEFRLITGVSGSCFINLWNYVSDGDTVNMALDIVTVDSGDSIKIGLHSSSGFGTFTQEFSGSPFNSTDNGSTILLLNQTIDSTKRYLKVWSGSADGINFNNVLIERA